MMDVSNVGKIKSLIKSDLYSLSLTFPICPLFINEMVLCVLPLKKTQSNHRMVILKNFKKQGAKIQGYIFFSGQYMQTDLETLFRYFHL